MQSEDRVIHFSVELIHPPVEHKKEQLQKLYFELSQTRTASYDNTDFTTPGQPKFSSRRGQKTQSVAIFLPDRVLLVEEWADVPLQKFLDRIRDVAATFFSTIPVPLLLMHTATVRSTFALTHFEDARVFLLDHALAQQGKLPPYLQRPIAVGGLRLVLPETNEHPGNLNISIESFRHSRNEVYVEVKGIFAARQLQPSEMEVVLSNVRSDRKFISQNIYGYLEQFDRPPAES